MTEKIGIIHPGEMGVSVAASAKNSGYPVFWVSQGRSQATRERAEEHGLVDCRSLETLCQTCSLILSVCPPYAAEAVAEEVIRHPFHGTYADLNAISPGRAKKIGEAMAAREIIFVDGGIIGGPAWKPDTTRLYLSGSEAERVAGCFSAGPLQTETIGKEIGRASSLKMCYGAYTKGRTALLAAILATAESLGVRDLLESEWGRDDPAFPGEVSRQVTRSTRKAWRFAGEMEEVSATFGEAGLPEGFHLAAAEIYKRLSNYKDHASAPALAEVLEVLTRGEDNT
jgi:3-hydroxyisobutyrate dehydrogenase-like beta-hydroxyacid dehydrogenase